MEKHHSHMIISLLLLFIYFQISLSIHVGYYINKCPQAEAIVRNVVAERFQQDKSITAALLRMHFHDCFVTGCDASILLDSTRNNQAEKDAGPNLTVREYELIDDIKSKLEAACPKKVSCADIIALATRAVVALAGGPVYNAATGRSDGLISKASDVILPGPSSTVTQALQAFTSRGLTLKDMVALLGGGHSVGVTHCSFFQERLSNFQGTGAPDTSMEKSLVDKLKGICGSNSNVDPTAFLDQNTPFFVDNEFFSEIKQGRGLLKIDQELALDPLSRKWVSNFAANNTIFSEGFVKAILKLGNIQVLQGNDGGEVRENCRVTNQ